MPSKKLYYNAESQSSSKGAEGDVTYVIVCTIVASYEHNIATYQTSCTAETTLKCLKQGTGYTRQWGATQTYARIVHKQTNTESFSNV